MATAPMAAAHKAIKDSLKQKSPAIAKILEDEEQYLQNNPVGNVHDAFVHQQQHVSQKACRSLEMAFSAPKANKKTPPKATDATDGGAQSEIGGGTGDGSRIVSSRPTRHSSRKRHVAPDFSPPPPRSASARKAGARGSSIKKSRDQSPSKTPIVKTTGGSKKQTPAKLQVVAEEPDQEHEEEEDDLNEDDEIVSNSSKITVPNDDDTKQMIQTMASHILSKYNNRRVVLKSVLFELGLMREANKCAKQRIKHLEDDLEESQRQYMEKSAELDAITKEDLLEGVKAEFSGMIAAMTDHEKALFENVRNLSEFQINLHHLLARNSAVSVVMGRSLGYEISVQRDAGHKVVFVDTPHSQRIFNEDTSQSIEDASKYEAIATVEEIVDPKAAVPLRALKSSKRTAKWVEEQQVPIDVTTPLTSPSPSVIQAKAKRQSNTDKLAELLAKRKLEKGGQQKRTVEIFDADEEEEKARKLAQMRASNTPLKLFLSDPNIFFFKYQISPKTAEGIVDVAKLMRGNQKEAKKRKIGEQRILLPIGSWSEIAWKTLRWFCCDFVCYRVLQAGEALGMAIVDGLPLEAVLWVTWKDPGFDWKAVLPKKSQISVFFKTLTLAINNNRSCLDTAQVKDFLNESIDPTTKAVAGSVGCAAAAVIPKPLDLKKRKSGASSTPGTVPKGGTKGNRRAVNNEEWDKSISQDQRVQYENMYLGVKLNLDKALKDMDCGNDPKKQQKSLVGILTKFLSSVVDDGLTSQLPVGPLTYIDIRKSLQACRDLMDQATPTMSILHLDSHPWNGILCRNWRECLPAISNQDYVRVLKSAFDAAQKRVGQWENTSETKKICKKINSNTGILNTVGKAREAFAGVYAIKKCMQEDGTMGYPRLQVIENMISGQKLKQVLTPRDAIYYTLVGEDDETEQPEQKEEAEEPEQKEEDETANETAASSGVGHESDEEGSESGGELAEMD